MSQVDQQSKREISSVLVNYTDGSDPSNLDLQNFTDCNKFHIDLTADEVETLRTNWGFAAQFSPCRKEH